MLRDTLKKMDTELKEVVKYVGAVYLFYLGVKSLLYRRDNE